MRHICPAGHKRVKCRKAYFDLKLDKLQSDCHSVQHSTYSPHSFIPLPTVGTTHPSNQHITTHPTNQYITHPTKQYITTHPTNHYITTHPTNHYITTHPTNQYITTYSAPVEASPSNRSLFAYVYNQCIDFLSTLHTNMLRSIKSRVRITRSPLDWGRWRILQLYPYYRESNLVPTLPCK
jgi:hypothetical protein